MNCEGLECHFMAFTPFFLFWMHFKFLNCDFNWGEWNCVRTFCCWNLIILVLISNIGFPFGNKTFRDKFSWTWYFNEIWCCQKLSQSCANNSPLISFSASFFFLPSSWHITFYQKQYVSWFHKIPFRTFLSWKIV